MRPLVTLILPVYNVEDYIDTCLASVTAQTYGNLEILLINDGSRDGSLPVCRKWEEKDPRIRVIDQENRGVSAARNRGLDEARGEVIGFVDPDDWLDLTYVEKLLSKMEETGAAFVECDLWRYDNRTGKKIYRSCGSRMGVSYTLREHMIYGPTATYKALSKKSLWDDHGVRLPSCSFESPAVYALILALAGRVENVPEALYYYRRFREDSLIETGYAGHDGRPDPTLGIEAMRHLLSEFRRCGLYEEYKDTLESVVKYRLGDILAMQFHRRTPEEYRILSGNCAAFCREEFPDSLNEAYLTFGGYNLGKVLSHLPVLHDPYGRFGFSSVISLLKERKEIPEARHKNRYRRMMLEREFKQD